MGRSIVSGSAVEHKGLHIFHAVTAKGAVAHMADSTGPLPLRLLREHGRYQAGALFQGNAVAIGISYSAAFLSPVLQERKAGSHQSGGPFYAKDAEYAAFFVYGSVYRHCTKLRKSGCGSNTVEEYSGWNCVPMNHFREGISTISTRLFSGLRPTHCIPAFS